MYGCAPRQPEAVSLDGALEAYDRLLASIGGRASEIGARPIVSHWPHRGSDGSRLLIVGQALFGWPDDWRASDAEGPTGREGVLAATRSRNADRAEPLDWIVGSDRCDKPFWKACRLLAEALEPDSPAPWYGRFTWANLFPVAWEATAGAPPGSPESKPGNPTGPLKEAQNGYVADLLRETVDWLDPSRVIVFGGPYWWPASAAVGGLSEHPRPLMQVGRADGQSWLVGWHPNGANRRGWTPDRYVTQILAALRDIEP
jgi:hypothetical protein